MWMLAINAFISDISEPDTRAFRYGILNICSQLGSPIGAPLGAYLLRRGGFICVFATSLTGIVLGSIWCVISIWPYKWTPKKELVCNMIKSYYIVATQYIICIIPVTN